MRLSIFVLLVAAGGGCHWDLNDPGTEPIVSQLYFPSGIAMDPTAQYAFVSNANADLKYGGGSLQTIDVRRFECAAAYFRQQKGLTTAAPDATCDLGLAMADTAFPWAQLDPLDPTIVDIDETPFIIPNATIKLGNFAGSVRLMPLPPASDPSTNNKRRLFVAVRGDPSVTYMDIDLGLIDPKNNVVTSLGTQNASPAGAVDCFTNANPVKKDAHGINISPPTCDRDHLLQLFNCRVGGTSSSGANPGAGFPFCGAGTDDVGNTQLPIEPFGMQLDIGPGYSHLLLSHLATGQVSLIDAFDGAPDHAGLPILDSTSQAFFSPTSTGIRGAFKLAPQHPGLDPALGLSTWYMTSNQLPVIATFHVATVNEIVPQGNFSLQSTFVVGNDMRDIIFDQGGDRAFITGNDPPTLLTLDTHTVQTPNGGLPVNQLVNAINICQTPSHMGLVRQVVQGAPGTPSRVRTRLVVVCFLSSQVMLVDPDRPGVDDTIYSGFNGPDDIAFTFDASLSDPATDKAGVHVATPWQHAWITNYTESTISVVELAPGSQNENRVIARMGFPQGGPQRGVTQ